MSGRLGHLLALIAVIASGAALARADAPTYSNVRVVAIDAISRTLVIENAGGAQEKVELDDNLAGVGDIRVGDRVIVSLRTGPGWARVTSIAKSRPVTAPKVTTATPAPSPRPASAEGSEVLAREAFTAQVVRVGQQADRVDRVWNDFRGTCSLIPGNPREGAREWFAVWEGSLRADMSGGVCRDLFNQIVDLGEPVKAEMTAAEDVARRTLSPGDIREIRRQYRMDWDGWALAPPKHLER